MLGMGVRAKLGKRRQPGEAEVDVVSTRRTGVTDVLLRNAA